ncbi:hypothetical protein HELRODRAFT_190525 [Helobdella robusta]|uniref:Hepatocyte growth factor-regulated tyrosine kinase substrate n=1 Tax=Helobdella robusta TaxID=6412 RepID=T1FS25_HELRO|nr:hypothetical protein HELRODRAFT_190525 [Helobdella robusta]ESO09504.1 hypothetical protein HELRODRAFT_190525 [Helobdella robusta]
MFSSKTAVFDRLLDKATSKLLLDPDWDSTLQLCDNIRQGDVQPSYALNAIKKKIENENPHVSKYALHVLESVVKNCGSIVHIEMATRDFMDFLKDQARKRQEPVKNKIVELVQVWSHAFRNEPSYKVVQDAYNEMKREGFAFPTLKESDAMFLAEKAPEWRDGELCHRCRAAFTTFNRKHHCRACGQVFCQKCSSKTSIIPKYGIEKEVRVCDSCFEQISKPASSAEKKDELPAEYLSSPLSKQSQAPPSRTEAEIQEEEELQLALALSQSEAEAKEKQKQRASYGFSSSNAASTMSSSSNKPTESLYSVPVKQSQQQPQQQPVMDTSDMDPELARYLNRNYWQQKSFEMKNPSVATNVPVTQPSAPLGSITANNKKIEENGLSEAAVAAVNNADEQQKGEDEEEREQFLKALSSSIEIFVNRMKSNSQRGRNITNDSSVQTLFMTLNAMHPTLLKYISQQEDNRAHYESLQDKLSQLKDARDALDVLREEHREKTRRKQEEMERLRQIQLAQKLEILRQKKQVYLEYQRQMALQRMHEQELEMRKRLEMQKQEQQMKAMQYGFPQGYAAQTMPPQPMMYQQIPGQVPYAVNQMQVPPTQAQQQQQQQPYLNNAYVQPGVAHPQPQQPNVAGYQPQMPLHEYPAASTLPQQQPIVPPAIVRPGINAVAEAQHQYAQQPPNINVANAQLPPTFQQQQQPNVAGYVPQQVMLNQQQQQLAYQQQPGMLQQAAPQQMAAYPLNYSQTTNSLPDPQQQGNYYSNGLAQHRPGPNEAELINFD